MHNLLPKTQISDTHIIIYIPRTIHSETLQGTLALIFHSRRDIRIYEEMEIEKPLVHKKIRCEGTEEEAVASRSPDQLTFAGLSLTRASLT